MKTEADGSDVATSQGTPGAIGSCKKQKDPAEALILDLWLLGIHLCCFKSSSLALAATGLSHTGVHVFLCHPGDLCLLSAEECGSMEEAWDEQPRVVATMQSPQLPLLL